MDRKPKEKISNYEPNTKYEWSPDDLFTVTGAEIDIWNKALATLVQSSEYQKFMTVTVAYQAMTNFIKDAVESGLMKKAIQDEQAESIS